MDYFIAFCIVKMCQMRRKQDIAITYHCYVWGWRFIWKNDVLNGFHSEDQLQSHRICHSFYAWKNHAVPLTLNHISNLTCQSFCSRSQLISRRPWRSSLHNKSLFQPNELPYIQSPSIHIKKLTFELFFRTIFWRNL